MTKNESCLPALKKNRIRIWADVDFLKFGLEGMLFLSLLMQFQYPTREMHLASSAMACIMAFELVVESEG